MSRNRTHLIEMNETQMSHLASLLRADRLAHPRRYADDDADRVNMLAYLEGSFTMTIDTLDADYDPTMLHGFTL